MQMQDHVINPDNIRKAESLIRPYIRKTPIVTIAGSDFGLPTIEIVLKLELFQHSGSFKARGAFTNMLMRKVPEAGVVAASGGNHGAAVAYAAMQLKKPAHIFVPAVASPAKMERIRSYGAELIISGDRYINALEASTRYAAESSALEIHAYDQVETIMGQGTTGMELEQQDPNLDSLLVAVGGGGLIGGIASWYRNRINIIGVEPEAAPTLKYALDAGMPVDAPAGGIAADSLAPRQVGKLMFPIAQEYVNQAILVTDEEIIQAQQLLWEKVRIVAEPGGAAALAALLSHRYVPQNSERVGVVICGGNTDAVDFTKKKTAT
jgi:threonine dehydratase